MGSHYQLNKWAFLNAVCFHLHSVNRKKPFLVHASHFEMYNKETRDFLANDVVIKVELKESPDKRSFLNGLTMHDLSSSDKC
ncbi:kinesin family member 3/17 [Clonorchis sinensis]|uniref:Kinesin family member 3/17 n=1 Tax=Clonorchis sinensis TaxID=79923 RepID=H2KNM0_CLOSI|nr:kinesin family member 3/17 [Clonorchis sinensis]